MGTPGDSIPENQQGQIAYSKAAVKEVQEPGNEGTLFPKIYRQHISLEVINDPGNSGSGGCRTKFRHSLSSLPPQPVHTEHRPPGGRNFYIGSTKFIADQLKCTPQETIG